MTPDVRPLVAGNWKMNGTRSSLDEIKAMAAGVDALTCNISTLICPPVTLLYVATALATDSKLEIGAQDCHAKASGAHTGDISAEMIADCFGTHVILGHSERRTDHEETDAEVRAKTEAAWRARLVAIVCIGETEAERKGGKTEAQRDTGRAEQVVAAQLKGSIPDGATAANIVVAYEPVWAIGTGLTPSTGDVEEAHAFMRAELVARFAGEGARMRILYGGSVKPANAVELMGVANVDGALVGGASLKSADFLAICKAYETLQA